MSEQRSDEATSELWDRTIPSLMYVHFVRAGYDSSQNVASFGPFFGATFFWHDPPGPRIVITERYEDVFKQRCYVIAVNDGKSWHLCGSEDAIGFDGVDINSLPPTEKADTPGAES